MREAEIRRENERYYYGYYIWSVRFLWLFPIGFVFVMTYISFKIRRLLLEESYFRQAGTTSVQGDMDVMEWVNARVSESRWDEPYVLICLTALVMIGTILFAVHVIKSYDLYKHGWIKLFPVLLYLAEFAFMYFFYYQNAHLPILFVALGANLIPGILFSRLMYPLESRPPAKGEKSLEAVLEFFTKIIIEKL